MSRQGGTEKRPGISRWSDDRFLNTLRQRGDPLADACLRSISSHLAEGDFGRLFADLTRDPSAPFSSDAPIELQQYFARASRIPSIGGEAVDLVRINRGQRVFLTHAFPSCMVLLAKSLPEGYAAPNISKILSLSGDLDHHPYTRLLGVLQMVVNVCAEGAFASTGTAPVTAAKLRLLHAGVRHVASKHLPDYEARYGVPVNLEDMLGTLMGCSQLVVAGLDALGVHLQPEEADDYYYLWRVFGLMMGIHPTDEPDDDTYIPGNLADAAEFYRAYERRHYVSPADNPEGVDLANANLRMLNDLLPQTPLRRLGMQIVPRIYMQILMGRDAMRRVGIRPVRGLPITKWLLRALPRLWIAFWDAADRLDRGGEAHENLSRIFFHEMIRRGAGGEVTFLIPDSLTDLRRLA